MRRTTILRSALGLVVLLAAIVPAVTAKAFRTGPLFDEFDLTLAPGHRIEALGPFYYKQEKLSERVWAVPPFVSLARDPEVELKELDVLYPVFSYDTYGEQRHWQFFQILNFHGAPMPEESIRNRFSVFPIYFEQRSIKSNENYTAVFPFYGHVKNQFFRDEVFWVMWPMYCQTRKGELITDNYVVPFFDLRHGGGVRGWQFWPLLGHDHKEITTKTNGFNEVTTVAGYDKFFALWPLYFNDTTGIGTDDRAWNLVSFPLFGIERSRKRDTTSVFMLFQHVTEREKKYREWDTPWPLIGFARGEGKTENRVLPFFNHLKTPTQTEISYMWPFYKYNRVHSDPLDQERTRVVFWLYSNLKVKNTETGRERRRVDVWPLMTHSRDFNGNSRWQILALLEPILPGAHKIQRDYSPLWSVWRSEKNPQTGASSQSLLWNFYRHNRTPAVRKTSFLFGLYQSQANAQGKRLRLFYIPLGRGKAPSGHSAGLRPSGEGKDPGAASGADVQELSGATVLLKQN